MAKATVTITCAQCGATVTLTATKRNTREAASWEDWMRSQATLCDKCYREQQDKQRQAADQAQGLPELVGSPKQVAWAIKIRREKLDGLNKILRPAGGVDERQAAQQRNRDHLWAIIAGQTEARWWIDRRDVMLANIVTEAVEAHKDEFEGAV